MKNERRSKLTFTPSRLHELGYTEQPSNFPASPGLWSLATRPSLGHWDLVIGEALGHWPPGPPPSTIHYSQSAIARKASFRHCPQPMFGLVLKVCCFSATPSSSYSLPHSAYYLQAPQQMPVGRMRRKHKWFRFCRRMLLRHSFLKTLTLLPTAIYRWTLFLRNAFNANPLLPRYRSDRNKLRTGRNIPSKQPIKQLAAGRRASLKAARLAQLVCFTPTVF